MWRLYALGIIASIAVGGAFFIERYVNNLRETREQMIEENQLLRLTAEQNQQTIEKLLADQQRIELLNRQLIEQNRAAEQVVNDLRGLFDEHDLEHLAYEKPGLIERRINDGTKQVFDRIERITDPNRVQPTDQ